MSVPLGKTDLWLFLGQSFFITFDSTGPDFPVRQTLVVDRDTTLSFSFFLSRSNDFRHGDSN